MRLLLELADIKKAQANFTSLGVIKRYFQRYDPYVKFQLSTNDTNKELERDPKEQPVKVILSTRLAQYYNSRYLAIRIEEQENENGEGTVKGFIEI